MLELLTLMLSIPDFQSHVPLRYSSLVGAVNDAVFKPRSSRRLGICQFGTLLASLTCEAVLSRPTFRVLTLLPLSSSF